MNNKFSFISNKKLLTKNENNLYSIVKSKINIYLKYINYDCLLQDDSSCIFGGAVRDSIADLEIHDVDVLTLPIAYRKISTILLDKGFLNISKSSIDLAIMYKELIIHEPTTFFKNDVFIQLIRPRFDSTDFQTSNYSKQFLKSFVSNVDISYCGVSLFNDELSEYYPDAINHCQIKKFHVIKNNNLYNENRIHSRIHKLKERGWQEIDFENKMALIDEGVIYKSSW